MQTTNIPSNKMVMSALLRADFTTQWRNRRSFILVLLVPCIILICWKGLIDKFGGVFILSSCITVGLTAIGLMGYCNAIARDRDKGVFQRLRVAPVSASNIMISRLTVQLLMILLVTTAIFVVGWNVDGVHLPAKSYLMGYLAAIVGGALYLGLAQMIVGLIKNAESVNAVSRLIYFLFIMVGMIAGFGALGEIVQNIVNWSPYGTVRHILSASMQAGAWDSKASMALLATMGYALIFSLLGIRLFKWSSR